MKRILNTNNMIVNVLKNGIGVMMNLLILIGFTTCYQNNPSFSKNHQEPEFEQNIDTSESENARLFNYSIPLDRLLDSIKVVNTVLCIHIDKGDYTLSLYADTLLVKQYPVVFGWNPVADKLRQGDGCTPEGNYKVLAKYDHDAWSKFIWIDYPNKESLVKFHEAKTNGVISPESTPGGEIGIHGVPINYDYVIDQGDNWTAGCIALKNRDINEIYNYVDVGTEVIIRR